MSDEVADGWRKGVADGWRIHRRAAFGSAQSTNITSNIYRPGLARESIVKFREGGVRYICYDYHSPQADGNDAVLAAKSTISLRNSMLIETPDLIDNDCSVARQL